MQNLAQFRSTSNSDGEYLRNRWRYSKSVSYLSTAIPHV